MGREKKVLGGLGEEIACEFLRKNGYKIRHVNSRTPFGEIDVVAKKKGFIVFIEVKTRSSLSLGPPCLSITRIKQRHMIKNALFFLKTKGFLRCDWRIDVVSIVTDHEQNVLNIELIENAVEDSYY